MGAQGGGCSEAVLGVDSSGNVLVWELRVGDGAWSSGRLLARVKEVGRVHSACLLLDAGRHWVLLCGSDRACVFDMTSRSKRLVLFCALSLQVVIVMVVMVMATDHGKCMNARENQ